MKLWITISLGIFLVTNIIIEILLRTIIPQMDENIIKLHGEKLKAIAATAAAYIDADDYALLNFNDPEVEKERSFQNIKSSLIRAKKTLNIKENIYTLNFIDSTKAIFGVMTNRTSFAGDTLSISNTEPKRAYKRAVKTRKCTYTGFYDDQYGMWISGIAPIIDSAGNTVGVVQADHESSFVKAAIDDEHDFIFNIRWLSLPVLLLFSLSVSRIIGSPIETLSKSINNISRGDYAELPKVRTFGETKKLYNNINALRLTILEQQEKIFKSIGELKAINEELLKAKEKAEESDKLKTEFLSLISHEVRTPINVLQNYLVIIEDELDEKTKEEFADLIPASQESLDRLIRTVELIVTMAELQTGAYKTEYSNFDLISAAEEAAQKYKSAAAKKGLDLNLTIKTDNAYIYADKYLARKAIDHLVNNAVKFTDNGKIEILLEDEGGTVGIKVKDTGIGIGDEFKGNIFHVFSQEDHGSTRKFDGNGLGLAMVKKNCEINNAELNFTSVKGKGSVFYINFKKS